MSKFAADTCDTFVPTTPKEITVSWLSQILQHDVSSFKIRKTTLDETTSKVFVVIDYRDGVECAETERPKHLCLKGSFNPQSMGQEWAGILQRLFRREVEFFNDVQHSLGGNLRTPRIWGSTTSASPFQAVLAMEDLSQRCHFLDGIEPWDVNRVKEGVGQLAVLHAATWGKTLKDHPRLTPDIYEQSIIDLADQWDTVVCGEDRPEVPKDIKSGQRTVPALKKHFASKNPRFSCVLHGDPHPWNTYIDEHGKLCFLDWQTAHIGSAFHDVAYFVAGALSVEDRRRHELSIIAHYVEMLGCHGGPSLFMTTQDGEVMTEYKKSLLTGIGWVMSPYTMQPKARVRVMTERYCAAIVDHEVIQLVESLPKPVSESL